MTGINAAQLIVWIVSALVGGSGLVGLLMIRPRKNVEQKLILEQRNADRLNKVDEHEELLQQMMEEQQILCYCTLAITKSMAAKDDYRNDASINAAIDMMEKHLNKKAHLL